MTAPGLRRLLIVCFGASGAAALIYQVAWVRLLTLSLGHTVAAASTVLAAFMGGLALGAWAAGRAADRRTTTLAMYAGLELFIAATAIALPAILASFDPFLVRAYADGTAPASFAIARIAVSFLLIGVPAAAMGATYPIAVAWLARIESADARSPQSITTAAGALYAANSAGAAAGAMAAGFWLIELLGIRGTTWVAVALNVVAAGLALWFGRGTIASTTGNVADLKVGTTYGQVGTTDGQADLELPRAAVEASSRIGYPTRHSPHSLLSQRRSQDSPLSCTRSRGRG